MSKIKRSLGVLAAIVLVASVTSGSALAATRPTVRTKAQWQAAIAQLRQPGSGCYHASYPVLRWHAVKCVTAPKVPLAPTPLATSGRRGGPETVGDGTDYSAVFQLAARSTLVSLLVTLVALPEPTDSDTPSLPPDAALAVSFTVASSAAVSTDTPAALLLV